VLYWSLYFEKLGLLLGYYSNIFADLIVEYLAPIDEVSKGSRDIGVHFWTVNKA